MQLFNNTNISDEQVIPEQELLEGGRILIIDDSENNIKVLGALLRNYNCEVLAAKDAKHGLSIAETKSPDLILLDVLMPETDGFEAYELLKSNKRTQHIPVIYLTASSNTMNVLKGFEMGAVDYITKPFNHRELMARIKNHLKLKNRNQHLKAMFNSTSQTFITLDKNLQITNFNAVANEHWWQFKKQQLKIGANAFSDPDEEDYLFIKKRLKKSLKGRIVEFEKCYLVNGKQKWFSYSIEPIKNEIGEIEGCMLSGTNITSKKETELEDANYLNKINDLMDETQQSMRYASYIQQSIFPDKSEVEANFTDCFIWFKPKDKVSGDFYWTHNMGSKSILILGDCTGHGVPGALLTTISIVLLERIVKFEKIVSPEEILAELNANIVRILSQKEGGIKDGMEMAVCLFDKEKKSVEYAGAKRSLIIAKGGEVSEIKGDRHDISGLELNKFTKHVLYPEEGSSLYVFSDGITDQIGGLRNKKIMKSRLKKLIEDVCDRSMNVQMEQFDKLILDWQGYEEQTDDMLLIGVRV